MYELEEEEEEEDEEEEVVEDDEGYDRDARRAAWRGPGLIATAPAAAHRYAWLDPCTRAAISSYGCPRRRRRLGSDVADADEWWMSRADRARRRRRQRREPRPWPGTPRLPFAGAALSMAASRSVAHDAALHESASITTELIDFDLMRAELAEVQVAQREQEQMLIEEAASMRPSRASIRPRPPSFARPTPSSAPRRTCCLHSSNRPTDHELELRRALAAASWRRACAATAAKSLVASADAPRRRDRQGLRGTRSSATCAHGGRSALASPSILPPRHSRGSRPRGVRRRAARAGDAREGGG